jgi:hypothetical protein
MIPDITKRNSSDIMTAAAIVPGVMPWWWNVSGSGTNMVGNEVGIADDDAAAVALSKGVEELSLASLAAATCEVIVPMPVRTGGA